MRFHVTSIVALQLTSYVLAAAPAQLKVTLVHWRRPEYSFEEFVEQFVDVYVPRISEIMKKYDIIELGSFLTTKEQSEQIKSIAPSNPPGYDYADYDLTMEYIIPSLDKLNQSLHDPDYPDTHELANKYIIPGKRRIAFGTYQDRSIATNARELK